MKESKTNKNIVWHQAHLTSDERTKHMGQKGAVVWLTGLSGAGKSTIAYSVEKSLTKKKKIAYVLDGDNLRHGLNQDLGFLPKDRQENIRRLSYVAQLFCDAHVITITAFISPYKEDRDQARALIPKGQFFEIFCSADLQVCKKRDPKGLYKKAEKEEINNFTGVSAPYEPPVKPELILHTDKEDISSCVRRVLKLLEEKGIID